MELIWNLKGSIPKKIAQGILSRNAITVEGLSLAETPGSESKKVMILLREDAKPFGWFTTGWIPPYSIQNIREGVIFNNMRLHPRLPADDESIYEATVISLD